MRFGVRLLGRDWSSGPTPAVADNRWNSSRVRSRPPLFTGMARSLRYVINGIAPSTVGGTDHFPRTPDEKGVLAYGCRCLNLVVWQSNTLSALGAGLPH